MWKIDKCHSALLEGSETEFNTPPEVNKLVDMNSPPATSRDYLVGIDLPTRFRLFDDDGFCYFEGSMTDVETADELVAFAPLDDYGRFWGCTTLKYRTAKGEWEIL